jgi:hypothetical protein
MAYWVKRIQLKSGEVITERQLKPNENRFSDPSPAVGDVITVAYNGRSFPAKVIWGNWPDREHDPSTVVPIRVEEI